MKRNIVLLLACALGACSYILTYEAPHYSVSSDNTAELKNLGVSNINVGTFTKTVRFDNDCAINAGSVVMPNKLSFEDYIRKGLVEELKTAGMYDDVAPKITLSGNVDQLSFFTSGYIYTSTWYIGLRINSSNGQSVHITDQYDFVTGTGSQADCQKIADSYMPAVQKILGKVIDSPEFQSLVTP